MEEQVSADIPGIDDCSFEHKRYTIRVADRCAICVFDGVSASSDDRKKVVVQHI
jgi:hypothetical protein